MKTYEAIGIIELQYFTFALEVADRMTKAANVKILTSENYLGGRLVSLVIGGSIPDINAAIEVAKEACESKQKNPLKMAVLISNPHPEILKFILPSKEDVVENQIEKQAEENDPQIKEELVIIKPKRTRRSRKVKEEELNHE